MICFVVDLVASETLSEIIGAIYWHCPRYQRLCCESFAWRIDGYDPRSLSLCGCVKDVVTLVCVCVDVTVEAACLPWATTQNFVKTDVKYQIHTPLPLNRPSSRIVASLCMSLGWILPLGTWWQETGGATPPSISLIDRYTLGGPMSLRGFQDFGVGPQAQGRRSEKQDTSTLSPKHTAFPSLTTAHGGKEDFTLTPTATQQGIPSPRDTGDTDWNALDLQEQGSAVGGLTKITLLGLVSAPIPFFGLDEQGFRSFLFVNMGSLGQGQWLAPTNGSYDWQQQWRGLFGVPRASVGGGISWNFANQMRVECTYALPLVVGEEDRLKQVQLGIGLTLL